MNALSNAPRSTTSKVLAKSSSVSPGNPTITSVETAISGIAVADRLEPAQVSLPAVRALHRLQHAVRPRLEREMDVLADRRRLRHRLDDVRREVVRVRRREPHAPDARRPRPPRAATRRTADGLAEPGTVTSRPYVFTFCPRSVTSTTPLRASPCTSARMSPIERERCGPRTSGTMQNVHALSHPGAIETHARNASRRTAGNAPGNISVYSSTSICGPSVSERFRRSSRCGTACVPTTTSTQGARRWISPSILLCEAPRHDDPQRGVAILHRFEMTQVPVELVVRVLPDRARVQHHDARAFEVLRGGHPVGRQQPRDALRIMLVHLTSEGADQVGAVHGSRVSPTGRLGPANRG